ncbi:MAG TPA: hypothetical protein VIS96_07295 [Terrimicrobiaceae bacterium]
MVDGPLDPETDDLTCRAPERPDLVNLCRELNERGALYLVIGGFAIIAAGYARTTGDVDLLIDAGVENEAKVFKALETLPDQCVKELEPGEVSEHVVVRVADEILVDLMTRASGIDYSEASKTLIVRELDGVAIPFAAPELLWRMKSRTHREKDRGDLQFLRMWFEAKGKTPPE